MSFQPYVPTLEELEARHAQRTVGAPHARARALGVRPLDQVEHPGFTPGSSEPSVTLLDGRVLSKSQLVGLEYGEDFLKLRELNEQKRRGFVEAMTDVDRWKQNIPIAGHAMGTVLPIRDLLQIKHIMTRLNAGESVSDEEMLKVQLFIEDQQRMSEASRGGMVGEVVRNMIGFGLELGAEMAVAGYVGGKLGLVGGPEGVPIGAAAGAFAAGMKKAGEGTVRGARHLVGKVVSRNVKDQVARMLATTAGKQIAKRSMSFAAGTVGAAYGGTILSGIEFGSRGLYNLAVGQDFGTSTEAAERYAGAAIGGEELSWRNAQLLAMADKWVENISEMAGATGTFEALIPGGSNQYIVKAMEKVFGKHITTGDTAAIKAALSTAKGAQRAKLTAALATASLVGRLAKDGDLAAALKRLGNFACDGYVEELLEERYGDFIRGFVGLEGDRKGIRNAIDQMIPDKEQFAVELISFAWPMAMQIGAHRAHLAIHGAGRGTFLNDANTIVRGTKDYSAPGRKLQVIEQEGALPVLPEGATGPQVTLGETGDTVSRVAREVRERPITPLGKALSWMVEAAHFAATGHIAGLVKFGGMDVYLANYGRAAFVGHHNLVYNAVESAMLAENESRKTPWTKAEIEAKAEAEAREATMDLLQGWRKSLALRESILERMNISEEEAARMTPEELREKLQQAANDGLIARIDFDTGRLPMWVKRFEDGADNPITSEMSDLYDLVSETMARHGFNIDEVTLNSAEDYRRRMENPLFGIAHAITTEELDEIIADPLSIRGSLAATIMNDISELQGSRRYDAIREWARWMRAHVDAGSFGNSYEALNPDGTVSGRIQLHRRGNGKVYLSYSPVTTGRVDEAAEAKVTAQKSRSDIAAINQTLGTQETGDNVAAATAALERLGYSRKDNMLILSPHRWFKATDPRFLTTNFYGMQDKSALASEKPEAILAAEAALRDLLNVSKDSDGYYRINIGSVNNEDVTRIAPHLDTYHAWEELAERLFKQDNVQERGAAHKADPRITSYFFNAVTSLREAAKAEDISEESRRAIYKLIDLLGDQQKSEAAVKLFGALFLGAGLDSRRRYGMSPIGYMDMIRVLRPFLTSAEGFQDYVQYMAHNILGIADAAGVVAPSQFELHYAGLHNPLSRAAHAALLSSVLKGKVDAEVPVAKEAPSGDMPLPKNPSYRALQQRAKQLGIKVEKGMSKAKLQAQVTKAELGLIQGEVAPVTAKGSLDTLFPQSKVDYDEETHTYKIDGEVRPSVTQLMDQNEDLRFDKAAVAERQAAGDKVVKQKILDRWKADADEGTAMHAELEAALKGGEVPEHLRELVDFLKSKGDVVSERVVWTDNYAGTADVIVVQPDGKLALYDLKTMGTSPYEKNSFYASSYKGTPSRHDKHVIQLMAYRQALEQAGFSVSEMGVIPASRKTREIYRGEIGDLVYPAKESHRARLYFNQVFGDEALKKPAPVKVKAEPPPKAPPKKSPVVHQLDADIMADLAKGQGFKLDDTSTPAAPKAAAGVLSKLAQRRAKGSDLSPSATGPTALVAEDAKVLQELSKLSLDTGVLAEAYQADEAFLSNADRKVLSRAGRELEAVLRDVLVYAYDDLLTAQGLDITDVAEFESNDVADPGLKEQIEDGPTRSLGSIKKAKAVAALLESLTGRDGYQVYYALAHNPKSAASLEAALLSAEALDAWVNSSDFVTPEADALRLALKLISTTAEAARDEKGKTPVAGLSLDSLRAGFATFRSMVQTSGAVMLSDGSIEIRNRMVPYAQAKADSERMRDHYVSHPRDLAKAVVEPYHRWVNRLKATEAAFADIKVEGRHVAALRTAELVKVLQTNDKLRSSLFEILSAYSGLSESFFGEVASSPAGLLALSEFVGTPFNFQFAPSSPVFGGSTIHTLRATPKADAAVNARLAAIRKAYEDAWLGVNLEKGSAVSRLASLMAHSSWTGEGTGTVFDAANKQQAGWIQHSKLTMKLRGFFERFGAVNWNDSEFTKKHPEALDPSNLIHLAAVTDAKGGERELTEASPAEMEHIIQEMERKGYLYLGVFGDKVNKMFARVQWLTPDQALTQYREWLTDPQKLVLEQAALVPIEELEALRARYDKATSKTERLEIQIAMNRPLMWGVLNDMVDGSLRYYLTGADVPAWALQKVSEVDAKYLDKSGKFVNDKSRKALKNVLSKSLDAAAKRRSNDLTGGLIGDLLEKHLKKLAPQRVNGKIRNVVLEYSGPRDGLNFDKRMDGMVIHRENTLGKAAVSAFGQMFAGGNEQHGASSLKFQISGVDAHGKPRLGKFHSQGVESLAGDREAFAQLRSFMQLHDIDQVTLVASEKVPSKQYFAEFRKGKADRIAVSNFADLLKLDTAEVAKSMQYVDGKDMIFPMKLHGETTIQRAKFGKQLLHIISSFRNSDVYTRLFEQWTAVNQQSNDFTNPAVLEAAVIRQLERGDPYPRQLALALRNGTMTLSSAATRNRMHIMSAIVRASQFRTGRRRGTVIMDIEGSGIAKDAYRLITNTGKYQAVFNAPERGVYDHVKLGKVQSLDEAKAALAAWYTDAYSQLNKGHALPRSARERADFAFAPGRMPLGHLFQTNTGADIVIPAGDNRLAFTTDAGGNALLRSSRPIVRLTDEGTVDPTSFRDDVFFQEGGVWYALGSAFVGDRIPADGVQSMAPLYKRAGFKNALVSGIEAAAAFIARVGGDGDGDATNLASLGTDFSDSAEGFANAFVNQLIHDFETSPEIREWASKGIDALTEMDEQIGEQVKFAEDTPIPVVPVGNSWERTLYMLKIGQIGMQTVGVAAKSNAAMQRALDLGAHTPVNATLTVTDADGNPVSLSIGRSAAAAAAITKDKHYWNRARMALFVGPQREISSSVDDAKYLTQGHLGFTPWVKAWVSTAIAFSNDIVEREGTFNFDAEFIDAAKVAEHIIRFAAYSPFFAEVNRLTTATAEHLTNKNAKPTMKPKAAMEHIIKKALNPKSRERTFVTEAEQEAYKALRESEAYKALDEKEKAAARYNFTLNETNIGNVLKIQEMAESLRALGQVTDLLINDPKAHTLDALDQYETSLDTVLAGVVDAEGLEAKQYSIYKPEMPPSSSIFYLYGTKLNHAIRNFNYFQSIAPHVYFAASPAGRAAQDRIRHEYKVKGQFTTPINTLFGLLQVQMAASRMREAWTGDALDMRFTPARLTALRAENVIQEPGKRPRVNQFLEAIWTSGAVDGGLVIAPPFGGKGASQMTEEAQQQARNDFDLLPEKLKLEIALSAYSTQVPSAGPAAHSFNQLMGNLTNSEFLKRLAQYESDAHEFLANTKSRAVVDLLANVVQLKGKDRYAARDHIARELVGVSYNRVSNAPFWAVDSAWEPAFDQAESASIFADEEFEVVAPPPEVYDPEIVGEATLEPSVKEVPETVKQVKQDFADFLEQKAQGRKTAEAAETAPVVRAFLQARSESSPYNAKEAAKADYVAGAPNRSWVLAPAMEQVAAGKKSFAVRLHHAALEHKVALFSLSDVEPGDRIYVSVPGFRRRAEPEALRSLIDTAMRAADLGAEIITDTEHHATRAHNVGGESVLREALLEAGLTELPEADFSVWKRTKDTRKPVEDSTVNDVAASEADDFIPPPPSAEELGYEESELRGLFPPDATDEMWEGPISLEPPLEGEEIRVSMGEEAPATPVAERKPGDIQLDDLPDPSTAGWVVASMDKNALPEGVPSKVGTIPVELSDKGLVRLHEGKLIFNEADARKEYARKPWADPPGGETPLPADAFRSFPEWLNFKLHKQAVLSTSPQVRADNPLHGLLQDNANRTAALHTGIHGRLYGKVAGAQSKAAAQRKVSNENARRVREATAPQAQDKTPTSVRQAMVAALQWEAPASAEDAGTVVGAATEANAHTTYKSKEEAKAAYAEGGKVLAPTTEQASFESYAGRLGDATAKRGLLVQSADDVKAGDRVYVSVPGGSRDVQAGVRERLIDLALEALDKGAVLVTDNEHHATRPHNVAGEGFLRHMLQDAGALETSHGEFSSWRKSEAGVTETPHILKVPAADAAMNFPMSAADNVTGKPTTTLQAIKEGWRTASTRHWKQIYQPGNRFYFEDRAGNRVLIEVEGMSESIGSLIRKAKGDAEAVLTELSKREGWTPEAFMQHYQPKGGVLDNSSRQLYFKLVGEAEAPEAEATPAAPEVQGANVWSGARGLAAALTNMTELARRKGRLSKAYPVTIGGQNFVDAEAAYKSRRSGDTAVDRAWMTDVIEAKLRQHPELVEGIDKAGGEAWLNASWHHTGTLSNRWTSVMPGKSLFIQVLRDAYNRVKGAESPAASETESAAPATTLTEYQGHPVTTATITGKTIVEFDPDAVASRLGITDKSQAQQFFEGNARVDALAGLGQSTYQEGGVQAARPTFSATPAPQAQESKTPGTSPLSPSATAPSARDALLNEYRRQRDARVSKLEQYLATQDAVKLPYAPRSKLTKAEATKEQGVWTIRLTGEDGKVHVTEGLDARQLGNTILDSVTDFRADSAPHHDQFIHASPRLAGILMEETAASEHVRAYAAEAIAALNLNPERYEQDVASVYRGAIDYAEKQGARATAELLRVLADNRALQPQRLEVRWDGAVLSTWDFLEPDRWQPEGYVRVDTNTLVLGTGALQNAKTAQTVLTHELLHAATAGLLNTNNDFRQSMEILRDIAEQYAVGDMRDAYGLTNVHEFVSEAFTNAKFRQFLASVESPLNTLPPGNLWQRFVALLKEYIGKLNPGKNTLLQNVVDVTLRNLDERLAEEAAWEADWESMLQADAATLSFGPSATAATASPPTAPIHERATTPKQLGNWMARAYATKHAANPADVGRLQRLVNSSLEPVLAGVAERQTFEEVVEFLHDIDPAKLHGDGGYFLGRIEAWAREHKQQNFTPEFIADIVAGRNTSASMQHFNSDYDSLEFSPSATSIFASPYTVGNTAAGGGATHMTNVLVKEAAFAARATNLVKRWQVHLINEWGLDGFIRPFVEHKFNIRPDGSVGEHKARGTRMFLAKRGGRKMTADQHKAVALMGHAAFLGFEHTREGPDGKRVWTGEDFGVLMPMLPWHADSRMLEALLPKSLAQELIWLRAKALEGVVRPMRTEDETEDSWRKRVATYERAVALRMSKAGIGAFQAVGRTWKQNLNVANMLKYEAAVTNPSKSLEFRDHWHARNIVFSIPASLIEKAFAADARKALIDMGRSPNRLTLAAFLNSAVQELDKVREAHNDNMPWSMHGDAMYLRTHKAYAPHWMGTGFAGANAGEAENAVQDLIRKIRKAQIDSVRAGVLAKKRKDNTLDSASDNMIRYMLELHGIPFHSAEEARKSIVDGDFEEMGIPRTADYYFIADAIHTAVSNVLVERAVHKQKIEERLGSIQNPVELAAAMREEWEARRDREVSHRAKRRVYTNFMEAYTMGNRRPLNIDAASAVNKYASEVLRSSQQRILLNEFVNTVDDFGRTQVVPDPDMMGELTHENEILSEQSWEQVLSNLAAQYKFQINPEKSTKANIRDIIDMHIKGSDRYTRVKSPFASIVEFYAYKRPVMEENIMDSAIAGGEVAGILKKLVTKPWQDPLKIIRFFEHVNAWMKVKSLQMSLFFPIAAQESVVALLGTDRFRTPEGMPSMLELRKMIVTNHPWAMNMLRQAMDAGIELGDVSSPLDLPMGLVERDVQDLTNFTRRNFGEQSAKIVNTIAGMDTKQSRFMFETYFNTVKLWGFIRFAHQLESKAIAEGRPFNLREELAPYVNQINQEIGGINWNKYSWMTPSWRRNMQLLMFSPNWSMSAWNAAGFGALTGPIMKNFMTADELNLVITRRWPSMFLYVMLLPPLMMQAFAYGVGKAFGPPDDDDELLMFNNEDGRKLHADLTPLMRLMPWYSGGQTGKRRVYIQWGKQAYETKRWLESPWNSLLNKTSQLARWAIEMATGESAGGYHWDLPFKGEGLLGWFRDRDGSFMGSRLAYTAQKFMPFTILAWASNPDASPFQILGPTSKGVSFHRATESYMSILDAWARRETYQKIHNNPTIQHNLETLGWEILDGARRNGYDSQKVFKSAYGAVIKDLYANLYKAINRNDMREIERWSRAILRLNGTVDNTLRSLRNRDKMHGEPEERTAEKEELIRQAFREP